MLLGTRIRNSASCCFWRIWFFSWKKLRSLPKQWLMQERKRQSSEPKATWPWGWHIVCRLLTVSGGPPTGPPESPEGAGWVPLSRGALPRPLGAQAPLHGGVCWWSPAGRCGVCPELRGPTHPTRQHAAVPQPRPEPALCAGMLVSGTRTEECSGLALVLSTCPSTCTSQFTGMCVCGLGARSTFCTCSLFR